MHHMQHYDFLTPVVLCTIMRRFTHIVHNTPGIRNRTLRPLGFKVLRVFPICMKRSIRTTMLLIIWFT